jgi:hypothetical protein
MTGSPFFDENTPLLIEVTAADQPGSDTQEILSLGPKVKQASDAAVRQTFGTVYRMARHTEALLEALQRPDGQSSVSGVEIEFGLTFNGNVEAYIAQAGAEAAVKVKISWAPQAVTRD